MSDRNRPRKNRLKGKAKKLPDRLMDANHPHDERPGGLKLEFITPMPAPADGILPTRSSLTSTRAPEVTGEGTSLNVMQGTHNFVIRDSNFYDAQKIEVHEHRCQDSIEKLNHEMTSYKTRQSSYGDPTGCMQGTRVKVLEQLDTWASDANSSRVYWMVGMAGIGKSTIAHMFCEHLEAKNILGGSFFASRASEKTRNARLIIPVIAHSLARASPAIKVEVVKAIEDDPTLAEPTYSNMKEQFKQLVYNPVRTTIGPVVVDKVVVIDAADECANLEVVALFIKLVLEWASKIPLKIFLASRVENRIRTAFRSTSDSIRGYFYLHDIEKDVVQNDIRIYLRTSLAGIKNDELSSLVTSSGRLFIYAATAIHYITNGGGDYKRRLSAMLSHGQKSINKFETEIDSLYVHVLEKVCEDKELDEVEDMRNVLSITIFLQNPLLMEAITSLSPESDVQLYLSWLTSVIHIPDQPGAVVAPFHASFPDFITNPVRCSPERCPSFPSLVASEGHTLIALKCLMLMNNSLKYNICEVPKQLTLSRRDRANSPESIGKISEVLKYSCTYWAAHLAEVKKFDPILVDALRIFLHKHLLHWIECLSILGELQTGLKSLGGVITVLLAFKFHDFQLLVYDAPWCLQMNFEAVQKHCMEIYESALIWIPQNSSIRKTYTANVSRVPKVTLGLSDLWDPAELIMQNGSWVLSVRFSQDGSRVVSGLYDDTVRIWNVMTGEVEAELKGHTDWVNSVAFSQDGSRVVSGSDDKMVRIWNVMTGEVEAELKGHTDWVNSVTFSQDGSRVVSGSDDKMVRIWNVMTGEVEAELKGHTDCVNSVTFSQDGSRVVSGSKDKMVRIWNVMTGEVEAELKGHTGGVKSVAFSQDGSRVVSGSEDKTVRIWNVTTGEVEAELKGHTYSVNSVAFSQDGS
ncbi:WD-40 repeat-containing protein [Laccaria bicolor S238N-H82]|uniref:WD-40 repeat-containing protein n=1 Tax=Laccaria bicolor (strain S238N-H82 / ATCC MYA-4686) TaxID=486041 RepID=B0E0S1_LACBS|nr:WD-40 repeat-containing protein [Laccaria bicolor S238N-H82]EDQ99574.1 WD-40 repeat-containing protein [Laccaria bicolor S238N-H82]|eukprot:XP_001889798.1 WD-40 repeat-containing protein [Laccaria bicolor S238N-H82]